MYFSELCHFANIPISLNVSEGARVLVLSDTRTPPRVVEALAIAVRHHRGLPVIMVVPAIETPGQEPAPPAAQAILGCDIVVGCCSQPITHTKAIQSGIQQGVRYIGMGSVSEDDLTSGAATADYRRIDVLTRRVADILAHGTEVHIASKCGTDVTMRINGRKAFCFSGVCREPQLSACFPDGEAAISPVEGTTNGRVVIDRSFHQIGHLRTPIILDIIEGRVQEIHGGSEAEILKEIWKNKGDRNSNHVAHISIGTNDRARITGNTQEHKKIYAGMHIGFGDDIFLGGHHKSNTHLDGIISSPTLTIDGEMILSSGDFSQSIKNLDSTEF